MQVDDNTQIWQLGVAELATAIRQKKISCLETVESHYERIEAVNDKVNAITVELRETAIEAARAADRRLKAGGDTPALLGVPMTVKENIDCAGSATTFGIKALRDVCPAVDAPHVKHLREAGAIPIARTNLPDLGLRIHTDNDLHGPTLNPWDRTRTPGGSSGGDAAAVATGMTPLGLGNDYGGSLRCPAQFCGVTALRPGLGRVPDHMSVLPTEPAITLQLFMVQGPLTRRVRDLRTVLEIMSQPDPRDPWWTPTPLKGPDPPRPIRVAMVLNPGDIDMAPAIADGIRKAARALADAGYRVEEVAPPLLTNIWKRWIELTGAELRRLTLPNVKHLISEGAIKFLTHWVDSLPDDNASDYILGLASRNRLARQWTLFQQRYPLVLGPVLPRQPFKLDEDIADLERFTSILKGYPLTMSANLLGLPAVAVPVGIAGGLPQGVQVIAPRYREDLCLDAAQAIEERLGVITPVDPG